MNAPYKDKGLIRLSLILYLFFLAFIPLVSTIALGITIVLWLMDGGWKNSFKSIKGNKTWWFFLAYYLFHVISLLWSENYKYAFFDLQVKLSFLLGPVVFAGISLSENDWKSLRRAFILGTFVTCLICLGHAFMQFNTEGTTEYFFYNKLSYFSHPTYLLIYLNLSLLFIVYELFDRKEDNRWWKRSYSIIIFIQLFVIFLLSARTALATCLITLIVYTIVLIRQSKLRRSDAPVVILFFATAILFQLGILHFNNRYEQVANMIEHPESKEENSTSIRYNLWKIAGDLISEHPVIGVGIGDIKEELVKKYEAYHYEYGIINRISPHNQYLHTAVILGITGVLLLIFMLGSAFFLAWRNGDWIYMLFIVIITLNCITESILERQAGILFFVIFNSLLASRLIGIENKISE